MYLVTFEGCFDGYGSVVSVIGNFLERKRAEEVINEYSQTVDNYIKENKIDTTIKDTKVLFDIYEIPIDKPLPLKRSKNNKDLFTDIIVGEASIC